MQIGTHRFYLHFDFIRSKYSMSCKTLSITIAKRQVSNMQLQFSLWYTVCEHDRSCVRTYRVYWSVVLLLKSFEPFHAKWLSKVSEAIHHRYNRWPQSQTDGSPWMHMDGISWKQYSFSVQLLSTPTFSAEGKQGPWNRNRARFLSHSLQWLLAQSAPYSTLDPIRKKGMG